MISHSMLLFLIGNNEHARGCYERYLQSADAAYNYMAGAIQMFISPFLSEPHSFQQPTEIIGLFWPKFLLQLQNSMTSVTCYYQRLGQLYQHRTVSTVPLGTLSEINGLKAIFFYYFFHSINISLSLILLWGIQRWSRHNSLHMQPIVWVRGRGKYTRWRSYVWGKFFL